MLFRSRFTRALSKTRTAMDSAILRASRRVLITYPSKHVDAPIIEEYPLTLECTVESFEAGNLIGNVINVSIDEDYLDENGKIDVDKMEIITFDMGNNTYRVLGENVGKAFKDGFDL